MKTLMESILQGYGSLVTVREGESARTFRALVQPVTEKGWQATRLVAQGVGFLVRRCETRYLADEAVYVWALLVKAGGEAAWSS